jgi:hypothetical protein
VLPSAARIATVNVAVLASGFKGLVLVTDLTAFVTAASVTPKIRGVDPVSGKKWDILLGAAIVANGTQILKVYAGMTAAANLVASDVIPANIEIEITHGNANSHTYSVGIHLIV